MGDAAEVFEVDFEFLDPKPEHFHSLKNLLTLLFKGEGSSVCLSRLADHLIEQTLRFGIVWQQCPDEGAGSVGSESEEGSDFEKSSQTESSGDEDSTQILKSNFTKTLESNSTKTLESNSTKTLESNSTKTLESNSTKTLESNSNNLSNSKEQSPAEDGEIFGVCTFVCLDSNCPSDFKNFIQSKQPKAKNGDLIFLSSRPSNVPMEICKSAYTFLLDDLSSGEDSVRQVFTLCPMAFAAEEPEEEEEGKRSGKKKKKKIQLHLFPENEMLEGFGAEKSIIKIGANETLQLIGLAKEDFIAYLKAVIDI
jgi:hypothetical protein